jgi:ATP-dependent exoDNAse (exonuclease V) beta subunit
MDPALSPEDALSAALPFVSMSLAAEISDEGERSRAHAQAASVLRRFVFGELGRRFRALQLVARELPTLAAAGGAADVEESESPVGFVAGAIDLLAADPATGEFIVVDYKTDAVRDESAMAARAESYRPQAEHYGAVLQEALRLPRKPRLELWFLAADRVLVL